jgi:hypothetical protein
VKVSPRAVWIASAVILGLAEGERYWPVPWPESLRFRLQR